MENDVEKRLQLLEEALKTLMRQRIDGSDIIPGSIDQTHMSVNNMVIVYDKASNRPTQGTNSLLAFFATDTNVLSIWNYTAWKSVTLT